MYTQPRESYWHRFSIDQAFPAIILVIVAILALPINANGAGDEQVASQLPAGKQTTLGLYVTSKEAYEKWKAAPAEVTIIDVRTPEEYLFIGHAEMAWNIPLAAQTYVWDAEKGQFPMQPLPDFADRVQKIAGPDDVLLVMCRSGGRSAMAVNLLANAGFQFVYNITDGFEGDAVKDPNSVFNGQRLVNGWKNSGLPWEYRVNPDRLVFPAEQ